MKKQLFDDSRNVKRALVLLYAVLVLLVIIDLFVTKHPHFPWEEHPSFYGTFGFVACVALVLAAKYLLRPFVKRKEDHYE